MAQESSEKVDFEYGEKLYGEGLFSMAVIQFKYFIEHYPNSPRAAEAHFLLAESVFSLKQYDEALKSYINLSRLYPSTPNAIRAQFRIGECFENMGKIQDAIESYSRFYSYYPESQWAIQSLYHAGLLAFEIGQYQKSESFLQCILDQVNRGEYRLKSLLLLSQLYQKQDEYEKSIQILQSYILQPIIESEKAKVLYRLGRIYEMLGNWGESEKQYRQIITMNDDELFKPYAWYRLGLLLRLEVKDQEALNAFQEVIQSGIGDSLYIKSMYCIGEIKNEMGDFQSAYDAFLSAEKSSSKPEERLASIYKKAKCLEQLGNDQEAVYEYQRIIEDTNRVLSISKKSLLSLAQLYTKMAVYDQAVGYYKHYLVLYEGDFLSDIILFRLGEIYLKHLNQYDAGFRALSQILEAYPTSRLIPEARFVYAETLEKMGRIEEAIQIYTFINRYYIGTQSAEKARDRLKIIEVYYLSDYQSGLVKLTELIQKTLSDPSNLNLIFELGEVSFHDLKQYKNAIQYYEKYLSIDSQSEKEDIAQFRIGQCYESLYFINKEAADLDSAKSKYHVVMNRFPGSPYACDAEFQLANLESIESKTNAYPLFRELLLKYPDYHQKDELLYRVGSLSIQHDAVDSSLKYFERLITECPESEHREEAFYQIGKTHYRLGNVHIADSLFILYCELYPEGSFLPEIYFYQAQEAIQQNDYETAAAILERLNQRFSFSPWSDSAHIDLANAYLEREEFEKAAVLYHEMVFEDSLSNFAASIGLIEKTRSRNNRNLIGLAKVLEELKQYKKAKLLCLKILKNNPDSTYRILALSSLARIAEKEGNISRATNYLNQIIEIFPADSTYKQLGLLYFRLGEYKKAIELLDQAGRLTHSEEQQILISSRRIVALLRQDLIQQAVARIAEFEKSFKDNVQLKSYLAEFIFEKGLIFTQEKEFDLALDSFQEIIQKYEETEYVPDAELEIGRIYLITNRIEDALNTLTRMVNQYPNHPILAKVYLNLGDHYFRSNQYDNALRSFKLSMQYDFDEEITPVTMRYLIRVYDSLRMWDAALSTTREYIAQYPGADDILEKRVQIGIFYMDLNEYIRAVEYLRDVKKDADFETEAEIQYWIGKCFYNMGQFEQAIFEFLKVEYLSKSTQLPWDITALYEAGLAYTKLEKPDEARKLFEKIVQREGATSDLGRIARERIEEIESQ